MRKKELFAVYFRKGCQSTFNPKGECKDGFLPGYWLELERKLLQDKQAEDFVVRFDEETGVLKVQGYTYEIAPNQKLIMVGEECHGEEQSFPVSLRFWDTTQTKNQLKIPG